MLRFQGYKRDSTPPTPDIMALFDEALALGRRLIVPRAAIRWAEVSEAAEHRVRVGPVLFTIPEIGRQWGPIEQVAGAVVTIGEVLEQRVAELWEARELPLASMLDSVGSGAVESLAEYVNDVLCQQGLPRGLKVTNRISPGYGSWDVGEQHWLMRLCPPEGIGVSLNAACFMTPTKTISLLVGAGPHARVDHYFSQCARCWMAQCAYRRTPRRGALLSRRGTPSPFRRSSRA